MSAVPRPCTEDGCDRAAAVRVYVPWAADRDVCLPHGRALATQDGVVAEMLTASERAHDESGSDDNSESGAEGTDENARSGADGSGKNARSGADGSDAGDPP